MDRIDKENYYLDIAETVLERSTCTKKHYGAVIVKDDRIISTGYNGAPRGRENCCDIGFCLRQEMNVPGGERYELCRSVHAEQNAIIHASYSDMHDATMYISGRDGKTNECEYREPCTICKRLIINSGISEVVIRNADGKTFNRIYVVEWIMNDDSLPE